MDSVDEPDVFSRVLPLPFRLELQIIVGFWLWALNLQIFHWANIDIYTLLKFPARPDGDEPLLHFSVYRLATILTGLWMTTIVFYWHITAGEVGRVIAYDWMPNVLLLVMLSIFFLPRWQIFRPLLGPGAAHGLLRLGAGLQRVSLGGIAGPKPEKFGDILLADVLTSYAKPISEVFVSVCMWLKGMGTTSRPDRTCGHSLLVPFAIAWPFAIRLRQCLKEGQWLNALKYSTAFPVIILSTLAPAGEESWFHAAWQLAAITNSLYSFWWDVSRDWDLTLLTSLSSFSSSNYKSPYGLRPRRAFSRLWLYYAVVLFDLVLRFAWSWKLSLHLIYLDVLEGKIFLLEMMELVRRWVWVYFRVETEWVRTVGAGQIGIEL